MFGKIGTKNFKLKIDESVKEFFNTLVEQKVREVLAMSNKVYSNNGRILYDRASFFFLFIKN